MVNEINSHGSKVYIIVLNWNGWQDTIECLASLLKLNYPNFQIIIVDNGSTDDSVTRIKAWIAGKNSCVLLEAKENLGFAAGNNVGLRYALDRNDFGYAWLLNNDTVVEPDALRYLVRRMREKPGAGICGSAVLKYHDRGTIASLGEVYDRWQAQGYQLEANKPYDPGKIEQYRKLEKKIDYIVGAAMLVSRDFLRDIGLLSEDYFLYFEEIDWATRACGKYSLALAPESIVYHKISESTKRQDDQNGKKEKRFSLVFDRYITKNRLLFTRKYFPYALPTVYISILTYIIDRVRVGAWENAWLIASIAWESLWRGQK
ncbi:MAG: glycosyltransferase family 2 protein [bacterium]